MGMARLRTSTGFSSASPIPTMPMDTKNKAATYVSTVVAGSLDGSPWLQLSVISSTLAGKANLSGDGLGTYLRFKTAVSAASYLDSNTGGVRMTDRLPAVASRMSKPGSFRLGMRPMCAVSVVWGGVTLIRDIYSGAASGEIVVTALQLIGDVHVLRDGSFAEVSFKP